LTYSLYN